MNSNDIPDDSLSKNFQIRLEYGNCYDGTFSNVRLNGVMVCARQSDKKNNVFLIGGLTPTMGQKLYFHKYEGLTKQWKEIPTDISCCPQFNICQHAVVEYKQRIYIIGGIAVIPSPDENKNERYNIPFISCYHLDKSMWTRINWNVYLRAHSVGLLGKYAIIDGGITEENKHSNKVYILDL